VFVFVKPPNHPADEAAGGGGEESERAGVLHEARHGPKRLEASAELREGNAERAPHQRLDAAQLLRAVHEGVQGWMGWVWVWVVHGVAVLAGFVYASDSRNSHGLFLLFLAIEKKREGKPN
jgi:hypothetical protein